MQKERYQNQRQKVTMTTKKLKLAWVENEKSRGKKLNKISVGLMKKVKELTILCDVKACMIIFSPNEVEPMVWPSAEKVRDLLDGFFALPEIKKKKKEMSLESYLKEKTKKVHEQFMKIQKKHMEYVIDQLMMKLHRGRGVYDLDLSEIHALISFLRDNIILHKNQLEGVECSPLREPPVPPSEAQFVDLRTTTNDAFVRGGQVDERAWKSTDQETKKVNNGNVLRRKNQSHYLIDKWVFPSPETPKPRNYQQIDMDMVSYNNNRTHVLYQGNSSNGNRNEATFHSLVGSVSQQLQHHNMIYNPTVAMRQPRQYPFDFISSEFGVKEEGSILDHGYSQSVERSNTIASNNGTLQEPPPHDGEGDAYVRSFDINKF